jgi:hypothetical protein
MTDTKIVFEQILSLETVDDWLASRLIVSSYGDAWPLRSLFELYAH